MQQLDKNTKIQ